MEQITWQDFEKVDIRTGTITAAELFPEAKKAAYRLTIDFGELGVRKSSAQVATLYQPHDLVGRQVIAVINFPVKQVANFISECLVLGAVQNDGSVVLLQTERMMANGVKIS
ncbi:MAG: tRNA-binding protein [Bacteroidota bacterium]|nr:tRNA-binding protein [Bacteroidota bacterium]